MVRVHRDVLLLNDAAPEDFQSLFSQRSSAQLPDPWHQQVHRRSLGSTAQPVLTTADHYKLLTVSFRSRGFPTLKHFGLNGLFGEEKGFISRGSWCRPAQMNLPNVIFLEVESSCPNESGLPLGSLQP